MCLTPNAAVDLCVMVLNCSAGVKIDARALCVFLPRDLAIGPVDKEYKRRPGDF